MNTKSKWWNRLFPQFGGSAKKSKYFTNISYKYHNQATNTIVVYNTSSRSLKEIKVIVKGSEHYEIELMINDLPYRGSIEVPLDSFKNSADIKVSLFIIDNWERYIFKEDGVIKRIK